MIFLTTKADALDIINFADDLASFHGLAIRLLAKIADYSAAATAVATDSASARQARYVAVVGAVLDPSDLTRIAALVPALNACVEHVATNYPDFLDPQQEP